MDLLGSKIHELTILERFKKGNRIYYKVKCSCGKKFETRRDSIISEKTKSCGHLTQFEGESLENKRFGKLTVIKNVGISKKGRKLWECDCDCGNKTVADTNNLKRGSTKSCGCIKIELARENEKHLKEWLDKDIRENTSLNIISREIPIKTNTSGVTGVTFDKSRGKWMAQIVFQGKRHYLGRFDKKEDAINARRVAEDKFFKPVIDKYKD